MERTKEQKKAIYLHGSDVLVAAAAGSGKTSVLIERLVSMVTDAQHPVDVDHLLVVTFTNAAASEMRERLEQALEERLAERPEDRNLQKQMLLLRHSHIMTIDSFCAELLRNHFQSIDLDPSFRIADATELKLLREDVMEEVLENAYEEAQEGDSFLMLSDSYAPGRSDAALEGMIRTLAETAEAFPYPERWLKEQEERLDKLCGDLSEQDWIVRLMEYKDLELSGCIEEARELYARYGREDALMPYMSAVYADLELLERLEKEKEYCSFAKELTEVSFARLGRLKKEIQEEWEAQAEEIKAVRAGIKDVVGSMQKRYLPMPSADGQDLPADMLLLQDLSGIVSPMKALLAVTVSYMEACQKEKLSRGILDFSDQEHLALKLLRGENGELTAVARELQAYFEEIYIDEYQDSNRLQEEILCAVSRGRNMFMVGDVKQSIYKFRQARPELFVEKYTRFAPTGEKELCAASQMEEPAYKIDLGMNFRSRRAVLDTVNFLFSRIMQKQLGKISYDENAALYYGSGERFEENEQDVAELILIPPMPHAQDRTSGKEAQESMQPKNNTPQKLEEKHKESKTAEEKERSKMEQEAAVVVSRILSLVGKDSCFMVQAEGGLRPAVYSDIVILLRTMSGWSEVFLKVFSEAGIPAQATTGTGYFQALEVKCVLNLLKVIGNEQQDIPLAAVMLSAVGSFVEEELAMIRAGYQGSFYDACTEYLENGADQELVQKLADFRAMIETFRQHADYLSVPELLEEIFLTTSYDQCVRAMPDGEKRYANLRILLTKAADFEKTSYHGLFQFNRYMERLKKYEVDFGEASVDSVSDAVRIMSIHKSKGLEFPIVFLCGMGKQFNLMDARKSIVIHPEYGIGADYVDLERHTKTPTVLKQFLQRDLVAETIAEELRVLYVAMTRASEKLIVTGFVEELERKEQRWELAGRGGKRLSFSTLAGASGFLDIIMPVVLGAQKGVCVKTGFDTLPLVFSCYDWRRSAQGAASTELGRMVKKQELLLHMQAAHGEDKEKIAVQQEKMAVELDRQLKWQYAFTDEVQMKAKFTVSELKRASMEEIEDTLLPHGDREKYIPSFLAKTEAYGSSFPSIGGARVGTMYHHFLQRLDFTADSINQVKAQLDLLVRQEIFTPQEAGMVSVKKIWHLLESPIGKRIRNAQIQGALFREQPFVMGVDSGRIFPEQTKNAQETVLVQGVIDLFFEENGGLILIDYKTDRIHTMEELKKRYQIQLDCYAEALEKGREMPVSGKYLYSFALGETIEL